MAKTCSIKILVDIYGSKIWKKNVHRRYIKKRIEVVHLLVCNQVCTGRFAIWGTVWEEAVKKTLTTYFFHFFIEQVKWNQMTFIHFPVLLYGRLSLYLFNVDELYNFNRNFFMYFLFQNILLILFTLSIHPFFFILVSILSSF